MKIIYISGKITGTKDYYSRFETMEKILKEMYPRSEIVNPVKICAPLPKMTSWKTYMKLCLISLKECSHIYMLDGWKGSKGARQEYRVAKRRKIKMLPSFREFVW